MVRMDFRDGVTPFALLEVVNRFKRMRPGEALEVLGNDRELRQDLIRVLPEGCLHVAAGDGAGEFVACIRKPARLVKCPD
jgi:TusA-related sulfurtransferase